MAYLDGELPAAQAVDSAAHLRQCAECRELADGLRSVSQALPAWEVEAPGERVARGVMEALTERSPAPAQRRWFGLPPWAWGLASAGAVVLVVVGVTLVRPLMQKLPPPAEALYKPVAGIADYGSRGKLGFATEPPPAAAPARRFIAEGAGGEAAEIVPNPDGPMIARTASLQLFTRDFDHIRARLDDILKRRGGYFGQLNIDSPTGSARTLSGKLRLPAAQLDAALAEIRALGHVYTESQNGEEVTAEFTDLEARLANSRHTEQRMADLLRERTGKLSDVLEAERELGRVRGEIEQMEAERKGLLKRVDYAIISLSVNEEYKEQLHAGSSASTQFRNAAVDGFRGVEGSVMGIALFLLSDGPVLLLWAAILFFPARFAWRRWQARRRG
jgi:hypothetical protein